MILGVYLCHYIMTRLKKIVPNFCNFKVLCFFRVTFLGISPRLCPIPKPLFSERNEGSVKSTWVVLLYLSVIMNVCNGHDSHILESFDMCFCSHARQLKLQISMPSLDKICSGLWVEIEWICGIQKKNDRSLWQHLFASIEILGELRITETALKRAVKEVTPFNTVDLSVHNHSVRTI